MKTHWIASGLPDKRLMVFFAGWGMDPEPFHFLKAGRRDVLFLYDYRETGDAPDLNAILDRYTSAILVCWSLGVCVGNRLCAPFASRFADAVAVNGTVHPVDPADGIEPEIYDATLANLKTGGVSRFTRRMCGSRAALARFLARAPHRDLADITDELARLRTWGSDTNRVFRRAWIGRHDRVFVPGNQVRCWRSLGVPYRIGDGPHFPFYDWERWEDIAGVAASD